MTHRFSQVLVLSVFLVLLCLWLGMSEARAELIWDDELGRYLTPQEMMQEDVYLTVDEALKLMFPDSQKIRHDVMTLTPELKQRVEERIGWHFPETQFEVYLGETDGEVDGYALVQNTVGKHKHMTYMVGVDPWGDVMNVELLVYRESRGSEVGRDRFNFQYEGKTVHDPIRINRDIINITGATMSVRSMSAGVKRVLVLVDEYYLKPIGRGSDTMEAKKRSKGLLERLLGF